MASKAESSLEPNTPPQNPKAHGSIPGLPFSEVQASLFYITVIIRTAIMNRRLCQEILWLATQLSVVSIQFLTSKRIKVSTSFEYPGSKFGQKIMQDYR